MKPFSIIVLTTKAGAIFGPAEPYAAEREPGGQHRPEFDRFPHSSLRLYDRGQLTCGLDRHSPGCQPCEVKSIRLFEKYMLTSIACAGEPDLPSAQNEEPSIRLDDRSSRRIIMTTPELSAWEEGVSLWEAVAKYSNEDLWNKFATLSEELNPKIPKAAPNELRKWEHAPPLEEDPVKRYNILSDKLGLIEGQLKSEIITSLIAGILLGVAYVPPRLRGRDPVLIDPDSWRRGQFRDLRLGPAVMSKGCGPTIAPRTRTKPWVNAPELRRSPRVRR